MGGVEAGDHQVGSDAKQSSGVVGLGMAARDGPEECHRGGNGDGAHVGLASVYPHEDAGAEQYEGVGSAGGQLAEDAQKQTV